MPCVYSFQNIEAHQEESLAKVKSAKILLVPQKCVIIMVLSKYSFFKYCYRNILLFYNASCKVIALSSIILDTNNIFAHCIIILKWELAKSNIFVVVWLISSNHFFSNPHFIMLKVYQQHFSCPKNSFLSWLKSHKCIIIFKAKLTKNHIIIIINYFIHYIL